MQFLKILVLVICTIVFGHPRIPQKLLHSWIKKGDHSSKSNCICYPEERILRPVHKILDPNDKGVERLVVYIYKTSNNGGLKIFVPNIQKQAKIPDIAYELGDDFITITAKSPVSLFDANPSKILLHHNYYETDKNVEYVVPIGLHNGPVVDIVNPEQNIYVPITDEKDTPNIYDNIYTEDNGLANTYPLNVNDDFYPKETIYEIEPQSMEDPIPNYVNGNNSIYDDYEPVEEIINDAELPSVIETDYTTIQNEVSRSPFSRWIHKQIKNFKNAQLPNIASIDSIFLKYQVRKILYKYRMKINADGIVTDPNGNLIDLDNLELRPFFIGNSIEYEIGNGIRKVPRFMAYIEGILVSIINPPFILGIIPIDNNFISSSATDVQKRVITQSLLKQFTKSLNNLFKHTSQSSNGMSQLNNRGDDKPTRDLPKKQRKPWAISRQSLPIANKLFKFAENILGPLQSANSEAPKEPATNNRRRITHHPGPPTRFKPVYDRFNNLYSGHHIQPMRNSFYDYNDGDYNDLDYISAIPTTEGKSLASFIGLEPLLEAFSKIISHSSHNLGRTVTEVPKTENVTESAVTENVTEVVDEASRQGEMFNMGDIAVKIIGGSAATGSGTPIHSKGRTSE